MQIQLYYTTTTKKYCVKSDVYQKNANILTFFIKRLDIL